MSGGKDDWKRLFKHLHACQCGTEKKQDHRHESINIYHTKHPKQLHIYYKMGFFSGPYSIRYEKRIFVKKYYQKSI